MNAELRLPPSARDFQVFHDVKILGCSTWREAQVFKISQTRVRQIVSRVSQWLADNLPEQTDLEREKEVRLAQHVAAERLQEMYCETMDLWRETHDSKYLRNAMRAATAMGRMGVVAGKLDEMLVRDEEEEGKAESGKRKAEPEAESGKPKAENASSPPVGDFSGNSAGGDAQQRRQEFLRGGNAVAVEGYVLSPRITEKEDIEVIKNWVELLRAAGVKPKAESGEPITEVRVQPEEPVTVTCGDGGHDITGR